METVQYTHRECCQRYEKQVRKYDPVQLYRLGLGDVFSSKQVDHRGRKDHPEYRDHRHNKSQRPEKPIRKFPTSSLVFSRMYVVKTGMNEAVIDPSATSRRNRLGIRYARL